MRKRKIKIAICASESINIIHSEASPRYESTNPLTRKKLNRS
jgi:hypothetical protein